MATFLLTWNPDGKAWSGGGYERVVEAHASGRSLSDRWGVGIRKSGIAAGDRAFLVRQRRERGIVASGFFLGEIYTAEHWEDPARLSTYADVRWDILLPVADRLPVSDLRQSVPMVAWDHLQGSGVLVASPGDRRLEQVWSRHTDGAPRDAPSGSRTEGRPAPPGPSGRRSANSGQAREARLPGDRADVLRG